MAKKEPSIIDAFTPLAALVIMLTLNIWVFKDMAASGPNQLALIVAAIVAFIVGIYKLKLDYKTLEKACIESITLSLHAILILLVVGSLIGVWILSGIVPSMIYYGLQVISPSYFLVSACVLCSIVSMATGSSWSTGGTVGVALMGIGQALGIPLPMVAGAIISGSYFGDKLSPLSDTTNLAAAMAGADLFDHVKHMLYTVIPSLILALLLFHFIATNSQDTISLEKVELITQSLQQHFRIGLFPFIVPVIVFIMVVKKVPALVALSAGVFLGALLAAVYQPSIFGDLSSLSTTQKWTTIYKQIMSVAASGMKMELADPETNALLSRGGMSSMLNTVWLIVCAMVFGGVMDACGMLQRLAQAMLSAVKSVGGLVFATQSTCVFLNISASDQYLSIVVAGKMFKQAYQDYRLHPVNLSRSLEDAGTVTSVLCPWNTCGAYFSSILGVSTFSYLPFCFFNLLSPIVSCTMASLGYSMRKIEE